MKNFWIVFLVLLFQGEDSFAMYRGYEEGLRTLLNWAQGEISEAKRCRHEDMPMKYKMTATRVRNGLHTKTGEFPCDPYEFYYKNFLLEGRENQELESPKTVIDPILSSQGFCRKAIEFPQQQSSQGLKKSVEESAYDEMIKTIILYVNKRESDVILSGFDEVRERYLQVERERLKQEKEDQIKLFKVRFSNLSKG